MFTLLSSPVTLLEQLKSFATHDLEKVCKNLTYIVEALSVEATQLIANRREHKVLMLNKTVDRVLSVSELNKLALPKVLLEQSSLVQIINSFCVSEAIVIRNNFSDCLETIIEERALLLPTTIAEKSVKSLSKKPVEKHNVSPIHLAQIKQRLAQATQDSSEKQMKIKNKLNALLNADKSKMALNSKQA